MKSNKNLSMLALALSLAGGIAHAADTYFMRVPAPAKCSTPGCGSQLLPTSAGQGGSGGSGGTGGGATPPVETPKTSTAVVATGDLSFPAVVQGAASPTKTVVFSNSGNGPMTLTSVSGLPASVTYSGSCSDIASGANCSLTFTLSTAAVGTWSSTVATVGANTNANLSLSASVTAAPAPTTVTNAGLTFVVPTWALTDLVSLRNVCPNATINGMTGWRLATDSELVSLFAAKGNRYMSAVGWRTAISDWYWSDSQYSGARYIVAKPFNATTSVCNTTDVCAYPVCVHQ